MPSAAPATRHPVTIEGERLVLSTLSGDHATKDYAAWLNDPVVNKYLETRSVTLSELRDFIAEKNANDAALLLGIFWRRSFSGVPKHIGNVKLEPIDWEEKKATMGILIGDKAYWGRGVATEVTNLISDYAFLTLGLREVRLGVISENTPAIRVYEKCGYEVYDVREKAMDHDGVLYDQICMRKLAPTI